MRGQRTGLTIAWLVLLTAVQILAVIMIWRFAVGTEQGQLIDTIALNGNTIGQDEVAGPVGTILNAVSVLSLVVATVVIGFIALIRRRIVLAVVTTLLIGGANLTIQVLKYAIERPDFGVDPERAVAGNSLPSGHTAVAASVALALVLVVPPRIRGWSALIATGYAAAAGVATLSAGWHRPSDAAASLLVVGAWASAAGLMLLLTQREEARTEAGDAHRAMATVLAVGGLALVTVAAVALGWTDGSRTVPVEELGRRQLFIAYAGSAAGIVGTAGLMMAGLLTTVHRVVPRYNG